MPEVSWSEAALRQLERSLSYIANDSPQAAEKLRLKIDKRATSLAITPLIGRIVPDYEREDIREIFVRPFRVIYQVREGVCEILAVVHGSRDLPAVFRPPDPDWE